MASTEDRITRWRRPITQMETQSHARVSEIKTGDSGRNLVGGYSSTAATSAHELAHRMERTVEGIRALESRFLASRCADSDEVVLYGGRKHKGRTETARPDKFVDSYVGKLYPPVEDSDGYPPTEVMSMGMESVFTGSHGGLIGMGKYEPDHHMRNFVLGVLACAGRKPQN